VDGKMVILELSPFRLFTHEPQSRFGGYHHGNYQKNQQTSSEKSLHETVAPINATAIFTFGKLPVKEKTRLLNIKSNQILNITLFLQSCFIPFLVGGKDYQSQDGYKSSEKQSCFSFHHEVIRIRKNWPVIKKKS
jgi:hypothetical protein